MVRMCAHARAFADALSQWIVRRRRNPFPESMQLRYPSKAMSENGTLSNKSFYSTLIILCVVLAAILPFFVTVVLNAAVSRGSTNKTNSVLAERIRGRLAELMSRKHQGNSTDGIAVGISDTLEEISQHLALLSNQSSFLHQFINTTSQKIASNVETRAGRIIIVSSCAALSPNSPSGYYWVRNSHGAAMPVYCDMTRSWGGVTGGWMRVAHLDMTNSSHQCPNNFKVGTWFNFSTCVRNVDSAGCTSIPIPVNAFYSKVCGRVVGYQVNSTNAFREYYHQSGTVNINSVYLDGISLTRGTPRKHLWSFASALDSVSSDGSTSICPCQRGTSAPKFVGEDYFCDSGIVTVYDETSASDRLQSSINNPLWDGISHCSCCRHPQWFYKRLFEPVTDDIEMRVCRSEYTANEDIALEIAEIYVQ